jgi:hypothetical protein
MTSTATVPKSTEMTDDEASKLLLSLSGTDPADTTSIFSPYPPNIGRGSAIVNISDVRYLSTESGATFGVIYWPNDATFPLSGMESKWNVTIGTQSSSSSTSAFTMPAARSAVAIGPVCPTVYFTALSADQRVLAPEQLMQMFTENFYWEVANSVSRADYDKYSELDTAVIKHGGIPGAFASDPFIKLTKHRSVGLLFKMHCNNATTFRIFLRYLVRGFYRGRVTFRLGSTRSMTPLSMGDDLFDECCRHKLFGLFGKVKQVRVSLFATPQVYSADFIDKFFQNSAGKLVGSTIRAHVFPGVAHIIRAVPQQVKRPFVSGKRGRDFDNTKPATAYRMSGIKLVMSGRCAKVCKTMDEMFSAQRHVPPMTDTVDSLVGQSSLAVTATH